MKPESICRTVHQYSSGPVPREDMQKLLEIAGDYCRVKNYVYQRYGGVRSLPKLYPGYTIQNEMTGSGLRQELGLPSVYFYLAVFDALGDIKTQWAGVRADIQAAVSRNEGFTPRDRHYLRFVVKVSGCFNGILAGGEAAVPEKLAAAYREAASGVDVRKLDSYLCRQARKCLKRLHTDKADGFGASGRAYRYGWNGKSHGIYISTRESRKRVFIPLTDSNEYKRQLYIKLKPEQSVIEVLAPVEVKVKVHGDYKNEVGLSAGMQTMLTTDRGHTYGAQLGELQDGFARFLQASSRTYLREKANNPGREKYRARKARWDARLGTYINREINRMLAEEKPGTIYLPRLPKPSRGGYNRKINYSVTVWKKGYILERLKQKCRQHSVEVVEVAGKAVSTECSRCGAAGRHSRGVFRCEACGYEADKKQNAAENALSRGRALAGGRVTEPAGNGMCS